MTEWYWNSSLHPSIVTNSWFDRRHIVALRTSSSSLARVYDNFAVWDFSPVRRSHSTRYEPACQDLLSRVNIVATYSRQVSREISLTCKRTLTLYVHCPICQFFTQRPGDSIPPLLRQLSPLPLTSPRDTFDSTNLRRCPGTRTSTFVFVLPPRPDTWPWNFSLPRTSIS
jgi:hypothetical protein